VSAAATPRSVWLRRIALMAVIGVAIAIPITIAVRSNEKEEPPPPPDVEEQLPLHPNVTDQELEIEYQVPEGWDQGASEGVLKLSSADNSVQVGISDPDGDAEKVLDQALADLKLTFTDVEVGRGSGKKIGGLPAKGAVVSAHNKADDVDLQILVAVGEGEKRTYLVEVFTTAAAPERPVAEAQRLLNSLKLQG
jgi:hypothetical protein